MNKTFVITLALLIGVLTFGSTSAWAQFCGDTTCNGTELPATCPVDCVPLLNPAGCGDGVCTGGDTPQNCPGDCGTCNCTPKFDGNPGSRCSSGTMLNGQVGIAGICDQDGSCTADCVNGEVTFSNSCTPWLPCAGGTNGSGVTACTYQATNHGDINIVAAPGCAQEGFCTINCANGVADVTNLCTLTPNNCSGGTSGTNESICSYPATNHLQSNVPGFCNEEGTCSVSCDDGVPTVVSTCNPWEDCVAGSTGSGATLCTYQAINHGAGPFTAVPGCSQSGSCTIGCSDGTPTVANSCTAPVGAPSLIAGCFVDTPALDVVKANDCGITAQCFAPCSSSVFYDVGNYFELGGYTLSNPGDWTFSWSGHSTCGTSASCLTPIQCTPPQPILTSTLNWTHIPSGDSGTKTVTTHCGTID